MNRRVRPPTQPLPPAPVLPLPEPSSPRAPAARASAARHAEAHFGVRHWWAHHRRASLDALARLRVQSVASLMTLTLGGLALALPLLLLCLSANLHVLVDGLRSSGEIAVFMKPGLDGARAERLAVELRARPTIAAVAIRTPAEGLQELRGIAGFGEAIAAIDGNPLPYLLLVQPRDEISVEELVASLSALADVDQIQHDQQWRLRLEQLLALLQRLAWASLLLFGLAALLVIGNSVRLEVAARSEEIDIIKLLGASDAFVRRPFLWSGFWLGTFSAVLAIALAFCVRAYFSASVQAFAATYDSTFTLHGPDPLLAVTTLVCGVLLGCAGAYLASTLRLISDRAS